MESSFTIISNGREIQFPESKRQEMTQEYFEGMLACEGSEQERYTNIYFDLKSGAKICRDFNDTPELTFAKTLAQIL